MVSGITGQMGSALAERLLDDGDKVIGIVRRSSTPNYWRIEDILNHKNLVLLEGDGCDAGFISRTISRYKPDIFFNAMGQSHVATSFEQPSYTWQITAEGVLNCLEAIRQFSKHTRFIQFSTSELFGSSYSVDENGEKYQDENTKFICESPYSVAKQASHEMVRLYRNSYGIWAAAIIMFNSEGPKRGEQFVTRKISKYIAGLTKACMSGPCRGELGKLGTQMTGFAFYEDKLKQYKKLKLGNIYASRDWSFYKDSIDAFIKLSYHDKAEEFVICTSETHTIEEFLQEAFSLVGLKWQDFVEIDESLKRPSEVEFLRGRYDKAKRILGWEPKVKFKELVKIMVDADLNRLGLASTRSEQ